MTQDHTGASGAKRYVHALSIEEREQALLNMLEAHTDTTRTAEPSVRVSGSACDWGRTWGKNPESHRAMGTAIRYATRRSIFSTMYSPDAVA